ncbi:MAG TPA: rhodanese-like domain-containing protein, partial [Fibrobacteraceae bacterium]|nr:rhodanese-like domain-containing protein [Fibrobacteraceae bacterium]
VSGGYTSLQRHARAMGFSVLQVPLAPIKAKSIQKGLPQEASIASNASLQQDGSTANRSSLHQTEHSAADTNTPIIVDVRTSREFARGAYPNAINIPLDELEERIDEFGPLTRKITVYCASGARSEYAKEILERNGFTNVINGGGIIQMMHRK